MYNIYIDLVSLKYFNLISKKQYHIKNQIQLSIILKPKDVNIVLYINLNLC